MTGLSKNIQASHKAHSNCPLEHLLVMASFSDTQVRRNIVSFKSHEPYDLPPITCRSSRVQLPPGSWQMPRRQAAAQPAAH